MRGYSRVVLLGNLTRDPELRQTAGGLAVVDIGLACNETYRGKDGESQERVCFVDVVAWDKQAELCAQYLKKGGPVLVEGRLQFDQWKANGGEKRSRLRVRADRVQFLAGGRGKSRKEEGAGDNHEEPMPF